MTDEDKNAAFWLGMAVAPTLLALGIYGWGKHKLNRALAISSSPEYRMKVRQALKEARKLAPKNTYISTTPKQLRKYLDTFDLEAPGEASDYWAYPLYTEDKQGNPKYYGALVNAPENAGTVDIGGLKHEVGHAIDFKNGDAWKDDNQGWLRDVRDQFVGIVAPLHTAQGRKELRAWELSGVPKGDPNRESALDTYRWHWRTNLLSRLLDLL